MEVWLPVREFPDHYEVSSLGRVRRSANGQGSRAGKVRKPCLGTNGYLHVVLSVNNRKYTRQVHLLVADTFLGPIPAGMTVNHEGRDGDRTNNAASNLKIVTMGQNHTHAYRVLGRSMPKAMMKDAVRPRGEQSGHAKLTWEKVHAIRQAYAAGGVRMRDLARQYSVGVPSIHGIIHHKTWK